MIPAVFPILNLLLSIKQNICRNTEFYQSMTHPVNLIEAAIIRPKRFSHNDQQIHIRVWAGCAPGLGAKQHNLFWGHRLHNGLSHLG